MVRGAVVQQPPVPLVGIDLSGVRPVICRALGQHLPEHALAPSLTVSLANLHGDNPPDSVIGRVHQHRSLPANGSQCQDRVLALTPPEGLPP
jgi:hypothetical protein